LAWWNYSTPPPACAWRCSWVATMSGRATGIVARPAACPPVWWTVSMPDDLSTHLIAARVEVVTAEGTDAARVRPPRGPPHGATSRPAASC
jgi:hypothetical protein